MADEPFDPSKVDRFYLLKHIFPKLAAAAGYVAYVQPNPPKTGWDWFCFCFILLSLIVSGFISWDGRDKVSG